MLSKLLPLAILAVAVAERPKVKDHAGLYLARISDLPIGTCGDDSYFGLGIMNGTLEKCSMWEETEVDKQAEYEEYKCKHLRVHAEMSNGKCVCKGNYKGAICNEYIGCKEGYTTYKGKCVQNRCMHDGELAVGSREIECICKVPWDGRFCEGLACYRKTDYGSDLRFNNDGKDKCKCGKHYTGENCDVITSCLNAAELVNGKCICPEGFGGEVCNIRCPKGQVTCSSSTVAFFLSFILAAIL